MSYIVNKTSGQALVTIIDGTTDTSTGVVLIGRNYTNYGEFQNENFVRLMENFAGDAPPDQTVGRYSLTGQLWYDTSEGSLKFYNGAVWSPVSGFVSSPTRPTDSNIVTGFQWWDSVNHQLYVYNSTGWTLVGPAASVLYGKTGPVVELVYDVGGTPHLVTKIYSEDTVLAVFSQDSFTPNVAIVNFPAELASGLTLATSAIVKGNVTNSLQLGGIDAENYIRSDVSVGLQYDLSVAGNIGTNGAYINVNPTFDSFELRNTNLNGSTNFYNNVNGTITSTLHIDGDTGLVSVSDDPVNNLGVATKQYVDTMSDTVANLVLQENTILAANLALFEVDVNANIDILQNEYAQLSSNLATLTDHVDHDMAPLDSPVLVGIPTSTTPQHWANTSQIATTYYVDRQDHEVLEYANLRLSNLTSELEARLTHDEQTFAPNASPSFTGTPSAPSPSYPSVSTPDRIATLGYVHASQEVWSGTDANGAYVNSKRYISTSAPNNSLGNNGDFWFQIAP